jgi:protein-L-isoaspartate(D-aspartate) O-methyltransferase
MPDPIDRHHSEGHRAQHGLVRTLVREGITDERVLAAFRLVRRDQFVPPTSRPHAYEDRPLPIAHGQVTTQPSLVARMLEALALKGAERVLEIGTGYGFQTALLARLAGEVISLERFPELAATARRNLDRQGVTGVEVLVGDGSVGAPGRAPFDSIVVSAAFTSVPQPLVEQLAMGGRLVQPMGSGGNDEVVLFERVPDGIQSRESLTPAHFVRLYGAHGFPPGEP